MTKALILALHAYLTLHTYKPFHKEDQMQQLKEENAVLKEKMTKLEQDILSLRLQNEQLTIGRGASSPNKRTRPDH